MALSGNAIFLKDPKKAQQDEGDNGPAEGCGEQAKGEVFQGHVLRGTLALSTKQDINP